MVLRFTVLGNPKPQSRPRFFRRGNFVRVYDKDKPDKDNFAEVAMYNAPKEPLTEPLVVNIIFYLKRPKNHYRTGKFAGVLKDTALNYHTRRPDIDNLSKFVLDSLNKVYWVDDSQIFQLNLTKKYDEEPRTCVEIML